MKYLLICSCGGKEQKAKNAYEILFPGQPTPQVVRGSDAIMKLAHQTNNDHIKAISKIKGNFAYYVNIDDNNEIIEEYDLNSGRRTK